MEANTPLEDIQKRHRNRVQIATEKRSLELHFTHSKVRTS